MQPLVALLTGLLTSVAAQQFSDPLAPWGPPPRHLLAPLPSDGPPLFDHATVDEISYAPSFRGFKNLVATDFVNIDRRFPYPLGFSYESRLYITERPKPPQLYGFAPPTPKYHEPPLYRNPPQVYEPGGEDSFNHLAPDFLPPSYPQAGNTGRGNIPHPYPQSGSYAPSFRGHSPPPVDEPPPTGASPTPYPRPSPPPALAVIPNIIQGESPTQGTVVSNDIDDRRRPYPPSFPGPLLYNTANRTVTPSYPPVLRGNELPPDYVPPSQFVPSLFETRPPYSPAPVSNTPPIFLAADSPNIIRGETSSSTIPSYDVSERPAPPYAQGPLLLSTPTPDSASGGLFTPRMFTPSSPYPRVLLGDSDNFQPKQSHVVFEAPGHNQPS